MFRTYILRVWGLGTRLGNYMLWTSIHVVDLHRDNIAINCNASLVARFPPSFSLLAVYTSCVKPGFCPESFEWW